MKGIRFIRALTTPWKPRGRRPKKAPPEIAPPVPLPFDFGSTARRPLVPLPAVALMLNRKPADVLHLIENGKLRWAFDIRRASSGRREVRVLHQSLFEFAGLHSPPSGERPNDEAEFMKVMDLVLPRSGAVGRAAAMQKLSQPAEPLLRGPQVAKAFSCHTQHVLNLIGEKSLQPVNCGKGPRSARHVTRASVIQFLKERRIS